jgi:hypothetical protein
VVIDDHVHTKTGRTYQYDARVSSEVWTPFDPLNPNYLMREFNSPFRNYRNQEIKDHHPFRARVKSEEQLAQLKHAFRNRLKDLMENRTNLQAKLTALAIAKEKRDSEVAGLRLQNEVLKRRLADMEAELYPEAGSF